MVQLAAVEEVVALGIHERGSLQMYCIARTSSSAGGVGSFLPRCCVETSQRKIVQHSLHRRPGTNMHVMHLLQVSAFNHLDGSGMSDKRFATRAGFGLDTTLWNQEADDLTNEEFGKSDESRRLHVVYEEKRLKVMSDILTLAAELDQETVLAKTSKEAKGMANGRIEKRKRGFEGSMVKRTWVKKD